MRIEDEHLKEVFINLLRDEYCRKILAEAEEPISVAELSKRLGIPLSSAHRCVKTLVEMGLITPVRFVITDDGKKYRLYQTAIEVIRVSFAKGDLTVEVKPKMELSDRFTKLLKEMRG